MVKLSQHLLTLTHSLVKLLYSRIIKKISIYTCIFTHSPMSPVPSIHPCFQFCNYISPIVSSVVSCVTSCVVSHIVSHVVSPVASPVASPVVSFVPVDHLCL